MKKKTRRFYLAAGIFIFAAGAVALTLNALKGSITYFYLPSDLAALEEKPTTAIRLGGLVETGSLAYGETEEDGKPHVAFAVTDGDTRINVAYVGLLPDLFREGQGVIVQGRFTPDGDHLNADTVLAKHDENYMPKEVADALKESGRWQETGGKAGTGSAPQN
ncbi:MAG TPA: cytochrome c maturation protein CcmE [Parvularculaceae bacterium]|nr:cytochrome c maturation protein CcmE [Parvularculaceae bacterium]